MELQLMGTAICRTPAFSPAERPEKCWQALKALIGEASPELYRVIETLDYSQLGQAGEKAAFSVWKYFNRARYRATPFGSFAAVSYIPILAGSGPIMLESNMVRHLFTDWSEKQDPESIKVCKWFHTNTTCYPVGREIRYIRFTEGQFELAAIAATTELEALLALCRYKAVNDDIYPVLGQYGLNRAAAGNLLWQMCNAQLLFSDRSANITGPDFFERLQTAGQKKYIIAERGLCGGAIDPAPVAPMAGYFNFMKDFAPAAAHPDLEAFRLGFLRKFGARAVPLSLAIDPETGVGYGDLASEPQEPALTGIIEHLQSKSKAPHEQAFTPQHAFLLDGLLNGGHIHLEDFKDSPLKPRQVLPNTFSAIFHYWNGVPVIESAGGCTANALLGRFTLTGGQALALGEQIAAAEEGANPDVLFFDLAYQAEKRVDNVNRRRQLYENELPLMTWSCHPDPLSTDDLFVMVSGGSLILWSAKYRKRVVPRIASAYNYTRSDLAIYRFLCDLQHQGISSDLTFSFRRLLPGLDHYPRVWYKNLVISPAMWKLPPMITNMKSLKNWLTEKNIYSPFKYGHSDQTLYFDPAKDDDLHACLTCLRQNGSREFYISEALTADTVAAKDGKAYIAQYIMNFAHTQQIYAACPPPERDTPGAIFYPGSEWLYLEVYCHPLRSNTILELIRKFTGAYKKQIKKWFFIRYTDPAPHIRLRLHLKDILSAGLIMNGIKTLLAPLCGSGLVSDIQVKTYARETARYGARRMPLAERHFYRDSIYVTGLLSRKKTITGLQILTLRLIDRWLFLANMKDTLSFVQMVAGKFSEEFLMDNDSFKRINKSYERVKTALDDCSFALSPLNEAVFFKVINACREGAEKENMMADLIHMHVNRVFYNNQRMHEAILYQYLLKILKARHFRAANATAR